MKTSATKQRAPAGYPHLLNTQTGRDWFTVTVTVRVESNGQPSVAGDRTGMVVPVGFRWRRRHAPRPSPGL